MKSRVLSAEIESPNPHGETKSINLGSQIHLARDSKTKLYNLEVTQIGTKSTFGENDGLVRQRPADPSTHKTYRQARSA